MQHDAVFGRIDAFDRTHRRARRVGAMHAGHRHRSFAWLAVIDCNDAAPVDAPWDFILVLAGGDTGIAIDAAVGVTKEFHSRHCLFLMLP